MPKWLTQEWLDETKKMAERQPQRPGASVRIQYVVTGGPEGEITYYWVLENGRILESRRGDLADAEVTTTTTYDDSKGIQKGELDATALFRQGRITAEGNMAKLPALIALTDTAEYKDLQKQILEITEF